MKNISLIKTIYINLKVFPINIAKRLPIIVGKNTKIYEIHKGNIVLNNYKDDYRVHIGMGGSAHLHSKYNLIKIGKEGKIIFNGDCYIGEGCSIRTDHGKITFGRDFSANKNLTINSEKSISFGDNCLIGTEVNLRDSDGHKLITDKHNNEERDINIGNNVWICSYVHILKGTNIPDGCVIGLGSIVNTSIQSKDCLIVGIPAKVKKKNIRWEK